ncbi:MAG: ATP-dependent DNA helicase [Lachnospiraceae bacterium]|nr:ATP-dependent DNA helicase [Lachnospiraceae bacterium]
MIQGGKLHRKIQNRMGADYKAEVPLKISVPYEDFEIVVDGRADGIIEGEVITIDEIKSVKRDISYIDEPVFVHKAQAMCYAYIYGNMKELSKLKVQLTYINQDTEEIKRFTEEFTFDYLKKWFMDVVDEYYKWAKYLSDNTKVTVETAKAMEFPYAYRKGQKEVAVGVYKAFMRGVDLFIQAPTGIGKTLSTIFLAVKSYGEGICNKIFYLTAKTIAATVAIDSFNILRENGLKFKSVTVTAKEKMCVMEECKCNPKDCDRAKGHFDRINDAIYDIITNESDITREKILDYSAKHNVCPFEMNLDISDWVDGIICDYNYAFDPHARLKRYFGDSVNGKYIFLVDEAHNLVDRAREMYSAVIVKEDILSVKKIFSNKDKRLSGNLEKLNRGFLHYKRLCTDGFLVLADLEEIIMPLMRFTSNFEKYIEEHSEFEGHDDAMNLYFAAKTFQDVYEILDDNYEIYCSFSDTGEFFIKLMCINPAVRLKECTEKIVSTIFFSATLLPVNYYKMLLTGDTEDYAMYIASPFDKKNRIIAIGSDVTSKYTRRGRNEYEKISLYISEIISKRQGNYMVFFPSYKMMKEVYDIFMEIAVNSRDCNIRTIIQENSMKEADREKFLMEFEDTENGTLVGFCVMGGIFSEGIDLKSDRLIGSIVVGTGLPLVCKERELIAEYFNERGMNGFDYAYKIPGMNKVMQAAGRVIRTDEDKGVIVLLDDRFLENSYRSLFPREWEDAKITNLKKIGYEIEKLWINQ